MSKANIDGLRGGTEKASSRQEEGPPLHHTVCSPTRACAGLFWCCLPPQVARLACREGSCEDAIPDGWCATSPFRSSIQFVPTTALRSREGRRPSRPAQQEMEVKLRRVFVMLACCSLFHAAESDSGCCCHSKLYRTALTGRGPGALSR